MCDVSLFKPHLVTCTIVADGLWDTHQLLISLLRPSCSLARYQETRKCLLLVFKKNLNQDFNSLQQKNLTNAYDLFITKQVLLSKVSLYRSQQNQLRFKTGAVWTPTYKLVIIHSFSAAGGHVPGVHLVVSILYSWSIIACWNVVSRGTSRIVFLPCLFFVVSLQLQQQLYSRINLGLNRHDRFYNYQIFS